MKFFVVALCITAVVVADEKYQDIGDDFNVTELLQNKRLLMAYIKCLLREGPCTPEVKQVKEKIPEALETNCAKCTDKQKQMGKQLARELKNQYPDLWKQLVALYDPQGKYQEAFKDFLASQ